MLTADLIRYSTRKGVIKPKYVDPEDVDLLAEAEHLIDSFKAHVGKGRAALDEAIADVPLGPVDPLLRRGLVKLLSDKSTFEVGTSVEPKEIREVVFGIAAPLFPLTIGGDAQLEVPLEPGEGPMRPFVHRDAVLKAAGEILKLSPEDVLEGLYGDLPEAHVLAEFKAMTPRALLDRYNTALAQGVILRASSLRITLKRLSQKRLRQIFRAIKFRRLMYRITRESKGTYVVELDGPVSLFKASNRYGLNMALFLPVLLNVKGWTLEATLLWGKKREERHFSLSPRQKLVGHHKDRGVYQTQQEAWFLERYEAVSTPWVLDPEPPFLEARGQEVIVPDYGLRHPDGRVAYLEILGFWRKAALQTRMRHLEKGDLGHLIIAVSKSLQGSQGGLDEVPGQVVYFREIIPPKEVIARAEEVGRVEQA